MTGGDVTAVRDDTEVYADGTVARVLAAPASERFPEGVKYAFRYEAAGAEHPIVRFDDHHGPHELHLRSTTFEFEFTGLGPSTGRGARHSRRRSAPTGDQIPGRHRSSGPTEQTPTQIMTTLHVRIGSPPDRTDLEETLDALDGGDDVEAREPTLTVADLETFGRVFRPTNLELLAAIATREPESLRELARIVDRHPPEVNDNVAELADYGLVELERNGRAKRPVVRYDEIDVELPIGDRSPDGDAAPA